MQKHRKPANVIFAGAITNASKRKKCKIRSLFDVRYWSSKVKYNLYIKFCANECERMEATEKREREKQQESVIERERKRVRGDKV